VREAAIAHADRGFARLDEEDVHPRTLPR
jgi:hypothetical protein